MIPSDLLELREEAPRLLSRGLRNGGDYADLFAETGDLDSFILRLHRGRKNELRQSQSISGCAVRVVSGGDSRFRFTDGLDLSGCERAASAVSGSDQADPPIRTPASGGDGSVAQLRALAEAAFETALSLQPDLDGLEISMKGRTRTALVAASDLPPAFSTMEWVGLRVKAHRMCHGRSLTSHAIGGGPGGLDRFLMHPPEEIAKECITRLEAVLDADASLEGAMPVVIAGGWGGAWLHEAAGHLLEADLAEGGPYVPARIGQRVAAESVTIIDRGSRNVDDEGVPGGHTALIQQGVLTALMTDRIRARAFELPLSGNGFRQDYRHEPLPRMSKLFLEPGTEVPERLIEEVTNGLYVRMISNGRVYPGEDRFSFDVAEGYRIEHGRLGKAVAGVRVHGRPSEMLLNVVGIAGDLTFDEGRGVCVKKGQKVMVSVGMPTILVNDLCVEPRP